MQSVCVYVYVCVCKCIGLWVLGRLSSCRRGVSYSVVFKDVRSHKIKIKLKSNRNNTVQSTKAKCIYMLLNNYHAIL